MPTDLDREIIRIGASGPRYTDATHSAFDRTTDALSFALARLPAARAGDGASSYFIYLALEQCRTYLRLDAQAARELEESAQVDLHGLSAAERDDLAAEYQRCSGFARRDWSSLATALGPDQPGAETEVGSVWFERAARAGYPPAVAEQALRPAPLSDADRMTLLKKSFGSGSSYVRWLLFADDATALSGRASVPALAWLIAACRGGFDCTEQAPWYRAYVCLADGLGCQRGESGLEHYWYAASGWERRQAWDLAGRIDASTSPGELDALPWPDLAGRDTRPEFDAALGAWAEAAP
jgi:hypothetical protein